MTRLYVKYISFNLNHASITLASGENVMIDIDHMTPIELQKAGLSLLAQELGTVGFIRFMQQFQPGRGNYTIDRRQWLDHLSVEDVLQLVQAEQDQPAPDA